MDLQIRLPGHKNNIRIIETAAIFDLTWLKLWLLAAAFDADPESPPPNPPALNVCEDAPAFEAFRNKISIVIE